MAEASHPKTGASHKRVGLVVRGKYRVDAFLATGTMANVYSATHRNGARVALKILHPQLAGDPSLTERFKREGYFANSIGHPGVVRAIDDDVTEDGCAFLVMELLEGESLDERRRRKGGKLPLSYVLPVADAVLEILAVAHSKDVVHRDLKPDNVFVTKDGDVKVLDFGLARFADGKTSSDMTGVGMVLGTPAYMPPEQALGRREDVDAQSDLWAFGATLFVVLSGETVHEGGDAKAKLIATARTAARPLQEAAPDVPRAVAAVIDRALAFHKKERWPDADAMREALRWARMSLEDRPSQEAVASQHDTAEAIPPPVPTRRALDDEPTIARAFSKLPPSSPTGMDTSPESRDFLTSAPPITLRDARKPSGSDPSVATSSNNEPVFSLRREKDEDELTMPSTERFPNPEDFPKPGDFPAKAAPVTRDSGAHARTMPVYDPTDDAIGASPPSSVESSARSVDVDFSFTRPMAAMVMPADYEPPRPAAGAPPATTTMPGFPPAPPQTGFSSAPPQQAQLSSAPPPAAPPPMGTFPPYAHASSPPAGFSALGTTPSLRVQEAALAAQASRRSLPPEDPGPLLSQIVAPRMKVARIVIPLLIGVVALGAVFMVVRMRAANAHGSPSNTSAAKGVSSDPAAAPPSSIASAPPSNATGALAHPGSTTSGTTTPATPSPSANAKEEEAKPAPVAVASTAADPPVKPKPKRRPRRPAATVTKPVESAEPAAATTTPTATATPTPPDPPPDTTPKDSLPSKDPEPQTAP